MRRALWLLFLLLFLGPAQSATVFPTCAYFGLKAPCFDVTTDIGDVMINIRVFGAKGDGTTDDTNAIQAAIDYAYNNGLQGTYCPSGSYKTTSTIYLDPPGNLRANLANPPLFSFSLAFIGESGGIGNGTGQGCQIKPNFNNGIAFLSGTGHDMRVSGISVIGPNNAYRGNLNKAGVGIGIAGGGGGANHTVIENTYVANFYTLYATDANGGCCLSDSNNFKSIRGDNGYIGVSLTGTQSFINEIDDPLFADVTIVIDDRYSHQLTVKGGNLSPFSSQGGSFTVSGTSTLTQAADKGFTFTTTVASPDIYWPNVYNAFTMKTVHFGVVPMTLDAWNSGTHVATFHITPPWATGNFATIDLSNASNSDLTAEIQAVTTVYAAEKITTVRGEGASLEGVHIENPNACQTLYYLQQVFGGAKRGTIKNLFFDSDPGLANYVPANSPTAQQLAWFYCQQTFGFIDGDNTGNQGRLEIDGGDFQQTSISPSLLFNLQPGFPFSGRQINGLAQINETVWDNVWDSYSELGAFWQADTVFNGAGDWDTNYFLPKVLPGAYPCTVPPFFEVGAVRCLMTQGKLSSPYHGYRPKPEVSPRLTPDIYSKVSGTLGVLGAYPMIDCETVYNSVAYNSGALTHIFARSASCPGYSYGQNLDDASIGAGQGGAGSNASFTATISNGAGGAGTQLNITVIASGAPTLNAEVTGTGVTVGTYITACPGGVCGGAGIYTVNNSLNISSEAMKSYATQQTWSYKGQSAMLYLDAKTLGWMFPGLGFQLSGGNNPSTDQYVVTGVYPELGYITASDSTTANGANPYSTPGGAPLQGTQTTIYSCSNQCAIKQAAYSWTQY